MSTLENLKKEAKRWLKAVRANEGDARARFLRACPGAPAHPTLRDIQHALAREHGMAGWAELKRQLTSAPADSAHAERVAAFLRCASLDWRTGGPDRARQMHAAARLLQ